MTIDDIYKAIADCVDLTDSDKDNLLDTVSEYIYKYVKEECSEC